MKLKGLVELMTAPKGYDEPDCDGPRDYRGCRIVFWSLTVFWLIVAIGVYTCAN